MTVQTLFVKRPETADLTRKIIAVLIGTNDEMSDEALSQMVGVPVRSDTYALRAALRDLERADPPVLFRRVRKFGWKRMRDTDIVVGSEGDLKKIARGARRGRKRLGKVVFDRLSNGEQLHAARNNTRFAAIEDAATTVKPRHTSTIPDLSSVLQKIKEVK